VKIIELSRTVAFRLTLFFSLFFAICVALLLGFVYWQTAQEMTRRVDQVLLLEKNDFSAMKEAQISDEIPRRIQRDQRHIYFYGLFGAGGQALAGNVPALPQNAPVDGNIYPVDRFFANDHAQPVPARVLIVPLGDRGSLLIGRDVQQLVEFGEIMRRAFFWGGSSAILLGLAFGLAMSIKPLRRIEQIRQVCGRIMGGNFRQRLPETAHRDELDMLAVIVNKMLDEIERLMSEIKSGSDNIAHDLRTPLTRLRTGLYRMQQQLSESPDQRLIVEQAIAEVDALLLRFRALLRISEIENSQRRVGFRAVALQEILAQAVDFFQPLAEDKGVILSMRAEETDPMHGDGELLFEAFVNLLDNAIKFTPAGGRVSALLVREKEGARVDIVDTGGGMQADEREAVLHRFNRGSNRMQAPGHGLGLSIVMAVVRLHNFRFELAGAEGGTRASIYF
jgi:signal transduction histidine kinase